MEPDDRASQRSGPKSGKRPDRGAEAAGQQGPYDHQDSPEPDQSQSDSREAEKPSERKQAAGPEKPSDRPAKAKKPRNRPAEPKKPSSRTAEPKEPSDQSQSDSGEAEKPKRSKADGVEERRPEPVAAKDNRPKTEDEPPPKAKREKREDERRRDEHVHQPSDVDARGEDKYRKVIGQHNPNRARQFLYYGIFIAFIVVAYLGLSAAVDKLDKAPAHDPAEAPWAQPGAPQGPLGGFAPSKPGQKGPTHFQ
jgi:hypothetical protein